MPTSSLAPPKVHRLGIVFTPSGTRFLCCKDCTLSIEIAEGPDATMRAARNKAKTIACQAFTRFDLRGMQKKWTGVHYGHVSCADP